MALPAKVKQSIPQLLPKEVAMQGFVDSFLTTLGAYLPSVLGALLIFVVGWLFAVAVKKGVARILARIGLDDRISDKSHEPLKVEKLLTGLVYYLILLFVLLLTLEALGVMGVLDPVMSLFDGFLRVLPNLVAATLIGVAGFVLAKILANSVLIAAKGLDKVAAKAGFTERINLARLLSQIVFVVVFVPVLISALSALRIEAISLPATEMLGTLLAAVPDILAALLILAVAYVLGRFVTNLIADLLQSMGADSWPEKMGAGALFGTQSRFSRCCAHIAFFFIMLGASVSAAEKLGILLLAAVLNSLMTFAGQILLGLVVLLIGNFLANLAYRTLSRTPDRTILAEIVRVALLALVLAMGLKAMGIADEIIDLAFGLALGGIAVAFALSFGLGGREAAGRHMDYWLERLRSKKGGNEP
jgi:hypothetical protein